MRQRYFPSKGGLIAGALILVLSLMTQPVDVDSVTARDLLVTLSAVFTGANLVGLLELRRQHEDMANKEPT